MTEAPKVIDDLSQPHPAARNGADWRLVADTVMGGNSEGRMRREVVAGRAALHMTGDVSLANNGGFLQLALDLAPDGEAVDARAWTGIEIDVFGDGETYNLHLRTTDLWLPWQSYRQNFDAPPRWTTRRLPFADFAPYRTDTPLALNKLRRLGVVAIGRAFQPDIAIGGVRFYA